MSWLFAIFAGFAPRFAITFGLFIGEWLSGQRRTDWWRNFQIWFLARIPAISMLPLLPNWGHWSMLRGADMPLWLGAPLFVLVSDCGEYLFHRAQHYVPFMWAMHSLHHSDPDMAAHTATRHFWGDAFLKQLTIWPATLFIIAPTPQMLMIMGWVGMWNIPVHSGLRLNLGRMSWLISSPAYHRRHHSSLPEHYNSNFAAIFPIFDVIFGSYHPPEGWPATGMPRRPQTLGELIIWPLIWNRAPRNG